MQFLNLPPTQVPLALLLRKRNDFQLNQEPIHPAQGEWVLADHGVPKLAWRYPGTCMLPLRTQVPCKKLGACSVSTQMLAQTLFLVSHPWSRVAAGREAGGGDNTPYGNSPGSAGMGAPRHGVQAGMWAEAAQGRPGFAWKEEANVLPSPVSCCCWFLGDNEGFYLPFSLPLAAWITGIIWSAGQCWCCGLPPAIPNMLPLGGSRGKSCGCAADAQGAADGCSFCCFLLPIDHSSTSSVPPPARTPAFAPWEVCAALGMRVIPSWRVPPPV